MTREDSEALEESRFVTLGLSNLGVYAYREPDIIRVDFSLEGEQTPEGTL